LQSTTYPCDWSFAFMCYITSYTWCTWYLFITLDLSTPAFYTGFGDALRFPDRVTVHKCRSSIRGSLVFREKLRMMICTLLDFLLTSKAGSSPSPIKRLMINDSCEMTTRSRMCRYRHVEENYLGEHQLRGANSPHGVSTVL